MTTPSPAVQYSDDGSTYQSAGTAFTGTANNSSATIKLANSTGANFWTLTCIATDETSDAATVNASIVINQTTKVASITTTATGTCMLMQSVVGIKGPGLGANGLPVESFTKLFEVNVLTIGGLMVQAVGETTELDPDFGYIAKSNQVARGGGSGWSTAADIDLSTFPNQSISTDGPYHIGPYLAIKYNSSNDNVAAAIVNGSGLVINSKTSAYASTTRTCPLVSFILSQFLPNTAGPDTPLRITCYISSHSITGGTGSQFMLTENPAAHTGIWGGIKNNGSNLASAYSNWNGQSGDQDAVSASGASTWDVFSVTFPCGLSNWIASIQGGVYSDGWPALSSMTPILSPYQGDVTNADMSVAVGQVGSWVISFGGFTSNVAYVSSATFARFKVETKP